VYLRETSLDLCETIFTQRSKEVSQRSTEGVFMKINKHFMLRRASSPPFLGRGRGWGTKTEERLLSGYRSLTTF
jgi:hypothetical protein